MTTNKYARRTALLLLILVALATSLSAQTVYGSLAGRVLDSTGAGIPQAELVIRNLETGAIRNAAVNEAGFWRMPSLPPGQYAVEATAKGFQKVVRSPLLVEPTVERTVEITMEPGAITETVTVIEEAPLIEATRAQLSRGVESRRILELPGLNTLTGLALLQPGVAPNTDGRPGSGFVVNGARTRSNNFMIDGANNNDQSLQTPRQSVVAEALNEIRFITNNFSAEFGRNAGSVVMQTTRSGSNEFHGILRWAWQGNGLNALTTGQQRTFSAQLAAGRTDQQALRLARSVQVYNSVVLSGGGPIVRNRTFFYTSYDRDLDRRTVSASIAVVPDEASFALLEANKAVFAPGAVDFLRANYPAANDPTDRGRVSVAMPDGRTLTIQFRQFNRGAAAGIPYGTEWHRGLMRVDNVLGSKDNLAVRYLVNDQWDPGFPAALRQNQQGTAGRNQSLTGNHARVFTPTLLSETRVTYARRSFNFPENYPTQFAVPGLTTIGNQNFPQYRTDNLYEFTNNWTNIRGSHTLRFGGNYLYYMLNSFFAPNLRGSVYYPSIGDFLFDRRGEYSQYAGDGLTPARTHEMQVFFGDDWRATGNLTLNLGVRYEFTSAPFGFFSNAKADINNWSPRFGFAYTPRTDASFLGWLTGNGKMSVRGGYAISYDQVFQNILLNNSRNYPRGVNVTYTGLDGYRLWLPDRRPVPAGPADFVKQGGNPDTLPVRLYSPNKRIKQPYSQQFSFGIERQFAGDYVFRVYYIGTLGNGLVREVETNLGFYAAAVNANPTLLQPVVQQFGMRPTTVGGLAAFRVDPSRGSILVGDGHARSNYHSLQLTLEKRFSKGFVFQSNYTWSAFISYSDDILGGSANRTLPSTPFNYSLDRGRSAFDQPHRWVTNYIWEAPKLETKNPVLERIVNGWQLSGITTIANGLPYSIFNANNALGILPGQISTVHLSQRAGYNSAGSKALGTAPGVTDNAFIALPANSGIIGNLGANTERKGHTRAFDVAAVKNIRSFRENHSLQLRWELFNAINFRNFTSTPANTVSASTNNALFNNLGQTDVGGRTMIFNVRYVF